MKVCVVGGGMFGCEIADCLMTSKNAAVKIDLYEARSELLLSASMNNQNRLHLGYHYPRDLETAIQCRESFDLFYQKYQSTIKDDFNNFYFIAKNDTKVDMRQFETFCHVAELPFDEIESNQVPFEISGVEGCIKVRESIYDVGALRKVVIQKLATSRVNVKYNRVVETIERSGSEFLVCDSTGVITKYDVVINASYENFNRYRDGLGIPKRQLKFQRTFIPIIEIKNFNYGVTIMDGPFLTILPFGKTGKFLLYDVENSVIDSQNGYEYPFSRLEISDFKTSERLLHARKSIFEKLDNFLPALDVKDTGESLFGPRAVLAGVEATDKRVSMIDLNFDDTYFDVIAGKVDQSMLVSADIFDALKLRK